MEEDCSSVGRTTLHDCAMAQVQVQGQDPRLDPMRVTSKVPQRLSAQTLPTQISRHALLGETSWRTTVMLRHCLQCTWKVTERHYGMHVTHLYHRSATTSKRA